MYFLGFSKSGWAVLRPNSLEEAIEWSKRFRKVVGDGESEIVQIFGPEDRGPARGAAEPVSAGNNDMRLVRKMAGLQLFKNSFQFMLNLK